MDNSSMGKKAAKAWEKLVAGNAKFSAKANKAKLAKLVEGQKPYAVIVSCSDSRSAPEIVLNHKALGKIFVVRVAGNIATDASVLGSVDYAVHHLHTPLIVVMGHSGCGAVKGAIAGGEHGNIANLLAHIHPATTNANGDVGKAVEENVKLQVANLLKNSAHVNELKGKGKLAVVGAVYDLASGQMKQVC